MSSRADNYVFCHMESTIVLGQQTKLQCRHTLVNTLWRVLVVDECGSTTSVCSVFVLGLDFDLCVSACESVHVCPALHSIAMCKASFCNNRA